MQTEPRKHGHCFVNDANARLAHSLGEAVPEPGRPRKRTKHGTRKEGRMCAKTCGTCSAGDEGKRKKCLLQTYLALTILSAFSLSPSSASPGRIRRWMISSFREARPISVRLYSSAIVSSETWQRARMSAMITPVPVSTLATGNCLVSFADASNGEKHLLGMAM
jgi:hypothetical protein